MISRPFLIMVCTLGLLACDPYPKGTLPPPGQNSLAFQYNGLKSTAAGAWGIGWQVLVDPGVGSSDRWHLEGPGTLLNLDRTAADLTSSNQGNAGYFLPPATLPAGDTTVYLSVEVFSPFTQRWETSQRFPIQVAATATLTYFVPFGMPTSVSLHAGGTFAFEVQADPRPLDFQQQTLVIPNVPAPADPGSVSLVPATDDTWGVLYKAPNTVSIPFDVTVRAIAHDPWANVDRVLDFTVHVDP